MALFGKKTAKKEAAATKEAPKGVTANTLALRDLSHTLKRPRITEKAVAAIDRNVYTFEIDPRATKFEVRDAIIALFKVTPVKIRMVNNKPRQFMSRARGRRLTVEGLKKAYVYLKEGDRIDLV